MDSWNETSQGSQEPSLDQKGMREEVTMFRPHREGFRGLPAQRRPRAESSSAASPALIFQRNFPKLAGSKSQEEEKTET